MNTNSKELSYNDLLQDRKWQNKRNEIIKRDDYKCLNCASSKDLQVHHRQYHIIKKTNEYKKPWDYTHRYLITLCQICHLDGHNHFKIPIFII
jgi:5-methylcytosine-specific restriction endonuclease McrA